MGEIAPSHAPQVSEQIANSNADSNAVRSRGLGPPPMPPAGQGTLRPERAIFYFDADDDRRMVRVLAVFFGGQDHRRGMLTRLLLR